MSNKKKIKYMKFEQAVKKLFRDYGIPPEKISEAMLNGELIVEAKHPVLGIMMPFRIESIDKDTGKFTGKFIE